MKPWKIAAMKTVILLGNVEHKSEIKIEFLFSLLNHNFVHWLNASLSHCEIEPLNDVEIFRMFKKETYYKGHQHLEKCLSFISTITIFPITIFFGGDFLYI